MSNPVVWFEIYVADMSRARAFYEAVLDVELVQLTDPTSDGFDMQGFPADQAGSGASGALVKMEGISPGSGGTIVYFSCDNCATEEARVAAAGGKVLKPKLSIGEHGFISMIEDSEGNQVGLYSLQ